jgi:uncharacterized tellurite resistance protein B-like protein
MHILLALLGTLVTILVLLYRLADIGIGLGGLNPFAWRRRRAWRQKFEANPIFSLDDPREIAAVLLAGLAKIDGDLSAEEKQSLLQEFEGSFSLPPKRASELLSSTVFMLGDLQVVSSQLDELIARYRERLDAAQIESLLSMLERMAQVGGAPSPRQETMLESIRAALATAPPAKGTWG